jgi:hypothetical protein
MSSTSGTTSYAKDADVNGTDKVVFDLRGNDTINSLENNDRKRRRNHYYLDGKTDPNERDKPKSRIEEVYVMEPLHRKGFTIPQMRSNTISYVDADIAPFMDLYRNDYDSIDIDWVPKSSSPPTLTPMLQVLAIFSDVDHTYLQSTLDKFFHDVPQTIRYDVFNTQCYCKETAVVVSHLVHSLFVLPRS